VPGRSYVREDRVFELAVNGGESARIARVISARSWRRGRGSTGLTNIMAHFRRPSLTFGEGATYAAPHVYTPAPY
jgi:hypothetical protein